MTELIGKVLDGKYQLTRLIGKGGMGSVYEAEHTVIKRRVAIKMLNPEHAQESDIVARFIREAQAASEIGHPNIIDIQDVGEDEGKTYIVMELLEGTSLSSLIRSRGKLEPEHAVAITRQIADGLEAAHIKGIVHRDLKADNVFVTYDERLGEQVKILDFGISKVMEKDGTDLTQTGTVMGTPHYMAPEQVRGERDVDARIDVWALGVMLYQMLTGTFPFPGTRTPEVLVRIITEPMEELPDLPDDLVAIVERSLEKDRGARFGSIAELRTALEPLEGRPATQPPDVLKLGLDETVATPSAQRRETTQPPRPPIWKHVLWYAVAIPIAWISLNALAQPGETYMAMKTVIIVAVSTALSVACVFIARFWSRARWNRWFQGPLFIVFPSAGLLIVLYHFLTLRGQMESHLLALRSYAHITTEHAARISELIGCTHQKFLAAMTSDFGFVCQLSLIVLLSYVFLRARKGDPGTWHRWLVLPGALAAIVLVEIAFAPRMAFMGPMRFILYLPWFLAAVTLLRLGRTRVRSIQPGWHVLVSAIISTAALSGMHMVMGYITLFGHISRFPLDEMPPAKREWLFGTEVNPHMIEGVIILWALLAVLFIALAIVCRRSLPLKNPAHLAVSLASIVITAVPALILLAAMQRADQQWSAYKFARMQPVTTSDRPYYINTEPESLERGADGLFALLTGEHRDDYTKEALVEALAGSTCEDLVSGSPARCVTAIEARLYCESLGKRLPTPEEWDHAVTSPGLERADMGEWTMRRVHGTATFEVRGSGAAPQIPVKLEPAEFSPHVGFRCAFSFEQ